MATTTYNVLLIEDDQEDAYLIEEYLKNVKNTFFNIKHCISIGCGLKELEKDSFDVILTDLGLPDSMGLSTVSKIINTTLKTPIIVLTGLEDKEIGLKALEMGAQDFISKRNYDSIQIYTSIQYAISRKHIEEDLRNNHNVLNTIFNDTPLLLFLIDHDHKIVRINNTALNLKGEIEKNITGIAVGEFLGCNVKYNGDDHLSGKCKNCRLKQTISETFQFKKKFKDIRLVLSVNQNNKKLNKIYNLSTAYVISNQKELVLVSLNDVTELENARKTIEKDNLKLLELNATKDKFFSIIAHDLKNPFNTILGYSELILSEYDSFSKEEQLKFISTIFKSSQKTFNLLENLLTWARAQSGKIEYVFEKIDVLELIEENISLLKETAGNKNIKLSTSTNNSQYVYADYDSVNMVLRNLISNAIKFTPREGRIKVEAELINETNFLKICVSDTGVGIEPEKIEQLFLINKNNSTEGTENESGSGLGLILCKEFIEKNKGEVMVTSKPGTGSTFCFTLPVNPE